MGHDAGVSSPAPDAPRELSARARRRAWAEAPVRLMLALAAALVLATIWLMATTIGDYLKERELIVQGDPATATIVSIAGDTRAFDVGRDEPVIVSALIARPDDEQPRSQKVTLFPHPLAGPVSVGDELEVRVRGVDRSASRFVVTDVLQPPSIWGRWYAVPPLLFLAGLLLVAAVLRRRTVLKVARLGRRVPAKVVSSRGTPLAPRSRELSVAADGSDRPAKLLHPNPAPAVGDTLDVLRHARGPTLAADLYA